MWWTLSVLDAVKYVAGENPLCRVDRLAVVLVIRVSDSLIESSTGEVNRCIRNLEDKTCADWTGDVVVFKT